jgi:tRNA dimethylallyltransferase
LRVSRPICYTLPVSNESEVEPPRIAIVGPTAIGKTAVGIQIAQELGTEIISADSMQVYRKFDIGTAKPTAAELAQVRFHGIDVADPAQEWTLADFQRLGETACDALAALGSAPLIVGGTGLYVRALTTDLDIPRTAPDEAFRARWRAIAEGQGNEHVRQALARVDPAAASRIHVNDIGRLIRALEVYEATGVSLSEWHLRNQAQAQTKNVRLFGLNFADRRHLYERIEIRVDQMMVAGFLGEVRDLLAAGYGRDLKPMQSRGYKQLVAHLHDELTLEDAIGQIKQETRHYARRQLIWFRADSRIHWLEAADKTSADLAREIQTRLATAQPHE